MAGFKILVLIVDIATNAPKRYEPPSPRNIFALGKLNLRNIIKVNITKNNNKLKSNYYVSVIINLIYLILIIPAIFMMNSGLFCKYYSLVFFAIYFFSYKKIYEKTKLNIK